MYLVPFGPPRLSWTREWDIMRVPAFWLWLCLATLPLRAWILGANVTAGITSVAWVLGAVALTAGWRRDRLVGFSWFFSWWGAYPLVGAWLVTLQIQLGAPSPVPSGILFCCVAAVTVLASMSRTPERLFARLNRIVVVSLAVSGSVAGAAVLDRFVVSYWVPLPPFQTLHPPGSRAHFETFEFDFKLEINSCGFREPERNYKRRPPVRVLCIGDSYTVGWGVAARETWVSILQERFGERVEFVNAGRSGFGPTDYANVAEEVVPVLRPDFVLVGILQGDDLAQSLDPPVPLSLPSQPVGPIGNQRNLIRSLCPNLLALRDRTLAPIVETRPAWKETAATIDRDRVAELDPEVRQYLLSGDLNPHLVNNGLYRPARFALTMQPDEGRTQELTTALAQRLLSIKRVSIRYGKGAAVCAVPYGLYVSRGPWEAHRRMGYQVEERFLTSNAPDEVIERACRTAELPFVSVTAGFRRAATTSDEPLYYRWDGHMTLEGHRQFANLLHESVKNLIGN